MKSIITSFTTLSRLIFTVVVLCSGCLNAAVFNVTTLNDGGFGSLREAINAVNSQPFNTSHTIVFEVAGVHLLFSGLPEIQRNLVMIGHSSGTIIDAAGNFRALNAGSSFITRFEMNDITVRNGSADSFPLTSDGGALFVTANNVVLSNCTFSSNSADRDGGGVYMAFVDSVIIEQCIFASNSAEAGGGLFVSGGGSVNIEIIDCRFSNNTTTGFFAEGGGMSFNTGGSFFGLISRSTFDGNQSVNGGGINFSGGGSGALTLVNCTISGNQAINGGGVNCTVGSLSTEIVNCTISLNSGSSGAGLRLTSSIILANSIISGNLDGDDLQVDASFMNHANNIVGSCNGSDCPTFYSSDDPLLGPLASNGGPTPTHALQVGSPAINMADVSLAPIEDQRGALRDAQPDIGAFESNSPLSVELIFLTAESVQDAIQILWTTASELNNSGYSIEKSLDGRTWKTIGWVEGAGNTSQHQEYLFLDENPKAGMNYYRYKQIDFDGEFEFSKIVVAEYNPRDIEIEIFPIPANEFLNVRINDWSRVRELNIIDQNGVKINQFPIPSEKLDLANLIPGVYIFVANVNGETKRKRFIKH